MRFLLLTLFLFGCAHKNRLDCIEICRGKGLRYTEIVPVTKGFDPVENELQHGEVCGCE